MPIEITQTFRPTSRQDWRNWLKNNQGSASEIWLVYARKSKDRVVSYIDAVEEALCFGWIDSVQKGLNETDTAQRFSPRKPKSNWTELNKARARRLIKLGLMTSSGQATLPDLSKVDEVPEYILEALAKNSQAKHNFDQFPPLYKRVRISYIDEMRKRPEELEKRLNNFLTKTAEGVLFGNWNDDWRLSDDE